jgi:hypothetical protein
VDRYQFSDDRRSFATSKKYFPANNVEKRVALPGGWNYASIKMIKSTAKWLKSGYGRRNCRFARFIRPMTLPKSFAVATLEGRLAESKPDFCAVAKS